MLIYDSGNYYDSGVSSNASGELLASFLPLIILGVFLLVFSAYFIFSYVMQAISLQTIARRRGIAHPWLAWIPYATNWIFGAIVSDYDKRNGVRRRWDKLLLTLSIVIVVFAVVMYIGIFVIVFVGAFLSALLEFSAEILSIILMIAMYALYIPFILIVSVFGSLSTICVFKLFESTVPDKALTYFLFYLLVPFAAPICLFLCRNKGYSAEIEEPDYYAE